MLDLLGVKTMLMFKLKVAGIGAMIQLKVVPILQLSLPMIFQWDWNICFPRTILPGWDTACLG